AAGADLVDLNFACPVRKVMRTGAGAALLGTPELAEACLRAAVEAVEGKVPVTVKIRSGLRAGDEAGRRLAPRLVAGGAAAVCVHPRSAAQLYGGRADHDVTLALARELPVPVIASGDVAATGAIGVPETRTLCAGLLDGGVAAIMVARAAVGRPWVFDELLTGDAGPAPAARLAEVRRFVADVEAALGRRAVGHLRQFWPRFRRHGVLDPALARELIVATEVADVDRLLAGAG
ncbi:MAG TPA: tRNA-dihydrouridine synthase family protein, partial [Thermoleophilia bacterium]|nr:tRNA-dihydrouridine synthase family protein [Thermoleophilia bacterium]